MKPAVRGLRSPAGFYTIRAEAPLFAAAVREHLAIEPAASGAVTFLLERAGGPAGRTGLREDILPASRTFFTKAQIERLPTGNSLHSLIENQDSISTSNRIDAGMWEALPSLFGSPWGRPPGPEYLRDDGMTSPDLIPEAALIVADVYALQSFSQANSAFPIQNADPGVDDLVPPAGASEFTEIWVSIWTNRSLHPISLPPGERRPDRNDRSTG
jgi:hypothetical protein